MAAVDYSIVHDILPGHGKPLNYTLPRKSPFFVGQPLPSALRSEDMNEGHAV
jgi:hypothetical protein